jgi:hypothetical protein
MSGSPSTGSRQVGATAVIGAAVIGAVALLAPAEAAHACDAELLAITAKNMRSAKDPELRLKKLAGSLAESCRFVPALREVLGTVPSVPPSGRAGLERKAVTGDEAAWGAACAGGMPAFEQASAAAGAARAAALWGPCDVQRYRFTDEAGLAQADGLVILSLLVARHFEANGVDDALAIPLLRGLAGVSGAAPAAAAASAGGGPWAAARAEIDAVKGKAFDAMPADQWKAVGARMLPVCEAARGRPEAERRANRQLEYDVCAHAGFAADNAGTQEAPLFRAVGGKQVNWGYYLAAATARPDPTLVTRTADETVRGAVSWYVDQLKAGAFPSP